jgi:hypothetical protein
MAGAINLQFQLTLDPATHADRDTVAALLNVFPPSLRPDVSVKVHLTESTAGGFALIMLTVIGPPLMWMGKKVLGPPLDEIGELLRDMVKEFRKRRRVPPEIITLRIELEKEPHEVIVGIPRQFLEESQHFLSTLIEQLTRVVAEEVFRGANRIMISWNVKQECWICTIWPTNMASTMEYLIYDMKTGQCEKKHL